jgi:uncharacterized membrane protein
MSANLSGGTRSARLPAFGSTRWPALAVVALSFALRLINLGGRPLWYDEAFAVLYAEKPFATMLHGTVAQVGGAAADVHPLFFYSVLHAWMSIVGQSPAAVRALSVLLGTATVVMVYLIARRLFDDMTGLVAAAIGAVSPFAIYYSQEARMYALLGFAAVTATYFFLRAWTDNRWYSWIAFSIFGALTLYAHNLGFAVILALDGWVLWKWFCQRSARWQRFLPLLLSHLLMLALFAPWLVYVPSQFDKIQQAYWVEKPSVTTLIQSILVFHFAYDNEALPGWTLAPALFLSFLVPAVAGLEFVRRSRHQGHGYYGSLALMLVLAVVPVLLILAVSLIRPVYIVRAVLPSALFYYVLLASLFASGGVPKPVRWGLLLPSLAIVTASLVNHYTYATFPRPPFDQVAAYLEKHYQPEDVIVHSNKLTFLPTHYYDRTLPQRFIGDEPGSPSDTLAYPTQEALGLYATADLASATQGFNRVWFVVFRRAVDEYLAAGLSDHPHRAWLEEHFELSSITSFHDLDVYEYRSEPLEVSALTSPHTAEECR